MALRFSGLVRVYLLFIYVTYLRQDAISILTKPENPSAVRVLGCIRDVLVVLFDTASGIVYSRKCWKENSW